MKVICSKSGTREKCPECDHSKEHEFRTDKGCDCGRCFPNVDVPNTITGELVSVAQQYPCVEVETKEETETTKGEKNE